jgi:hypothetical protein
MSGVHTAREAVLTALMADIDQVLRAADARTAAMDEASERLSAAVALVLSSTQASTTAAKASVGEFIARQVNDATQQGRRELQEAAQEASAQHLQVVSGALERHLAETLAKLRSEWLPPPKPPWRGWPWVIGVSSALAGAAVTWWVLRG